MSNTLIDYMIEIATERKPQFVKTKCKGNDVDIYVASVDVNGKMLNYDWVWKTFSHYVVANADIGDTARHNHGNYDIGMEYVSKTLGKFKIIYTNNTTNTRIYMAKRVLDMLLQDPKITDRVKALYDGAL